jgi:hypothetical protein
MILFSLINVLAQSIAALLIFLVGYLALLICAIAGLAIADLIYRAARLLWSRTKARPARAHAVSAKAAGAAQMVLCQAEIIRPQVTPVRRTGA